MDSRTEVEGREIVPSFLQGLTLDYPQAAEQIVADLAVWITKLDEMAGVPGLAQKILDRTEYISKDQIKSFVDKVTQEVTAILQSDPTQKVIFVTYGGESQSGRFFFDWLKAELPVQLADAISLVPAFDLDSTLDKTSAKHVFYLDDSSNSGQQLYQCLVPLKSFVDAHQKDCREILVHVRLLQIAPEGRDSFQTIEKFLYGSPVKLDIQATAMPNMRDVQNDLGSTFGLLSPTARRSFLSEHNMGVATLAIMWHKFTDNLPPFYTTGKMAKELQSHGIKPLFHDLNFSQYSRQNEVI